MWQWYVPARHLVTSIVNVASDQPWDSCSWGIIMLSSNFTIPTYAGPTTDWFLVWCRTTSLLDFRNQVSDWNSCAAKLKRHLSTTVPGLSEAIGSCSKVESKSWTARPTNTQSHVEYELVSKTNMMLAICQCHVGACSFYILGCYEVSNAYEKNGTEADFTLCHKYSEVLCKHLKWIMWG